MQGGTDAGLIAGRFEPVGVAGHGGQGRVLKAIDRHHDRLVALKIRSLGGTSRSEVLAEARVLLDVRPHRGLPIVRDDFFDGEHHVMVMDWIEGEDLAAARTARGTPGLPPAEVVGVLTEAAAAIDHLHAHDPAVFHQDVKPANLIRATDGRVVLVDLGVAGAAAARLGTPGYRAPELLAGDAVTPATDVFGLAATAFSLLTGMRPGPSARAAWDALPAGAIAERAIRRSLATDPTRRHRSAAAFVDELRAWLAGTIGPGRGTVLLAAFDAAERAGGEVPSAFGAALEHGRALLASVAARHGGTPVEGEQPFAVFADAAIALTAAADLRERAHREPWPTPDPVTLRIAIATGEIDRSAQRVGGGAVSLARHLLAATPPGHVLLDAGSAPAAGPLLVDHGPHRLADLGPAVHVMELPGGRAPASVRSLDAVRHRLPEVVGGLDVDGHLTGAVIDALRGARLVTVTGPDASSVALAAAAASAERFSDVRHVRPEAGTREDDVAAAVAASMDVTGGMDAATEAVRGRRVLLVFQDCDVTMEPVAYVVEALLKACPELWVLASATAPLMVPGESVIDLPR